MSKRTILIFTLIIGTMLGIVASCTKSTTVLEDNTAVLTTPVSFSKDIQPILVKSCALNGCHSGSVAPDLSLSTAFTSLTAGGFVDTAAPKNSDVYLWLTGKKAVAMPLGSANNPSNINVLMLTWISQGAKNN